jgi:cell filamentation protein
MARNRYDVSSDPQARFEPGSRNRVLANRLGIRRARDMGLAESQALELAQSAAIEAFTSEHRFTAADIRGLHRLWLGPIYDWAGEYRSVNISKGGFMFAAAGRIPHLMDQFGRKVLAARTPCRPAADRVIAEALAVVHAELVLIHPFREGNGRIARLLAGLMALQANLPPLDFSALDGRGRRFYIGGIHAAMGGDHELLTNLFARLIARTRRPFSSSTR